MRWALTYFVPDPPLYTTVSIDYIFVCTPGYKLLWTQWDGSRDKNIFGAAGVQSRRHCTPRLLSSVYFCIHRLPFCLYPRLPALLDAVGWVPDKNIFGAAGRRYTVPPGSFFPSVYYYIYIFFFFVLSSSSGVGAGGGLE